MGRNHAWFWRGICRACGAGATRIAAAPPNPAAPHPTHPPPPVRCSLSGALDTADIQEHQSLRARVVSRSAVRRLARAFRVCQ